MKRTLTINLGGRQFVIDDDAYTMLREYFTAIEHVFARNGEQEVVDDIEGRMAEILSEQMSAPQYIITIADVEKGIERIGKPEDFIDETVEYVHSDADGRIEVEEERINVRGATPPPPPVNIPPKRLYRDPRDRILGGVCSGLAWYIGCDPVWVRLVTVALCFASLSIVALFYLVLWIILPAATTPYERLQMMGKSPSVQNIGRMVTDDFDLRNDVNAIQEKKSVGRSIAEVCGWMVKAFIILLCVILCPVVIGIALALIGCLIAVIGFAIPSFTGIVDGNFNGIEIFRIRTIVWCGIGWLITIGIPLAFAVYKLFGVMTKREMRVSRPAMISSLIIWIIGAVLATVMTMKAVQDDYNYTHSESGSKAALIEQLLNGKIEDMNNVAEEAASSAEDASQAAEEISDKAEELSDSIMKIVDP